MGKYAAGQIVKKMIKKGIQVKGANILVLGITFKENCPDVRNTKVVDVIHELLEFDTSVTVYDPWANHDEVKREYGLDILTKQPQGTFDAVVFAVTHKQFEKIDFSKYLKPNGILYNIK